MFLLGMFNDPAILSIPSARIRSWVARLIVWRRLDAAWEHYEAMGGASPLVPLTEALATRMAGLLRMPVWMAMRYSLPRADEAARTLVAEGVDELFLLPLYPQFSTTTTQSSVQDFVAALARAGFQGQTKTLKQFYAHEPYNRVILARIKEALGGRDAAMYDLVFSAHGLPVRVIEKGDPYQRQLKAHLWHLRRLLLAEGLRFRATHLAYQSRVGPMRWLEPSLEAKLEEIRLHNDRVLVYPIAFCIDNLETVYELDIDYRKRAVDLGYAEYAVASVPNDTDETAAALAALVRF